VVVGVSVVNELSVVSMVSGVVSVGIQLPSMQSCSNGAGNIMQ
jgi:hypothetical protein